MDWLTPLTLPIIAASPAVDPCSALEILDANRAVAYATADPSILDDIYAAGSAAWTADRDILDGYRARGLRVVGADLELLDCRVVDRTPTRARLAVTDRLRSSWAIDQQGVATKLPRDRATHRSLTLHLTSGHWTLG